MFHLHLQIKTKELCKVGFMILQHFFAFEKFRGNYTKCHFQCFALILLGWLTLIFCHIAGMEDLSRNVNDVGLCPLYFLSY